MGDLTKNLSRSEFACECECGFDTVDMELALAVQAIADLFRARDGIDIRIDILSFTYFYYTFLLMALT